MQSQPPGVSFTIRVASFAIVAHGEFDPPMNRVATALTMIALALLAGVSLVLAAGGTNPDENAHARRTHTPTTHATPSAPCDDAPCTVTRTAPRASSVTTTSTSVVSPVAPRAPQAPAPAPDRRDKDESGRQAPATGAHLHRPVSHRAKASVRSAPATPGMGFLLRIGTGAGPELSLLLEDVPCTPLTLRAGRAPPRGPTTLNPARDPIACAAALEPHQHSARVPSPGAPLPDHLPAPRCVFARLQRVRTYVPTDAMARCGLDRDSKRLNVSRADCLKGASA